MNTTRKNSLLLSFALVLRFIGTGVASACAPVVGFFVRPTAAVTFFGIRTIIAFALGNLSCYLPTLAGSLVVSTNSRLASIGIPLLCMGLFLVHPVGATSWVYSLYWLVPIGLSFISSPSIFVRALMSTYTTHAVGSVIWLYTHVTTAVYWHMLISQVWLERLAYAGLLVGSYYVIIYSSTFIRKVAHVKTSYPLFGSALRTSHS